MSSILDYFPAPFKPREVQARTLLELEQSWDKYDVFVINLPVASGKSYIAKTIVDWQKEGAIITPTNLLVDQYRKDFPKLAGLYGKQHYSCKDKDYSNCMSHIEAYKRAKVRPVTCQGCPWFKDHKKMHSPWVKKYVTNNHLYAQMGKYQRVLIVDEAHNLTSFLQDWHSSRLDYDRYKYPRNSGGYIKRPQLLNWLKSLQNFEEMLESPKRGQKALKELYRELTSYSPRYLITEETEERTDALGNTTSKKYLKLGPIDVRNSPPILWPGGKVSKIVLMSATIGRKDIEEIGLAHHRVKYIEADSCIPAERRPVNFVPVASVKGAKLDESITSIAEFLLETVRARPGEKGLIHATYAQAALLRRLLRDEPRIMFHSRTDKKEKYRQFREAEDGRVLVASGLYEGIDLPDEAGRFQVVTKVPWPSLMEPAISYRAKKDSEWYSWAATKVMLQACGRICRSPEDFGETFIIDRSFEMLYDKNPAMYPDWFKQSVTKVKMKGDRR